MGAGPLGAGTMGGPMAAGPMGGQMWPQWPPMAGPPTAWPAQSGPMEQGGSTGSDGAWSPREEEEDAPRETVPIFLEPAVEEFVPVPKALLGKVIGKQAQTIIEIREKSGAFKVDARDQASDPCQVKVAGTAEAVKKARELIMELVDSTNHKHAESEYVEIPRTKIGMVIGLKGAQVNEIQTQTGTKIDVDFENDRVSATSKGWRIM